MFGFCFDHYKKLEMVNLIKKAHQEAHSCYATVEVHDWIDWFEKELRG